MIAIYIHMLCVCIIMYTVYLIWAAFKGIHAQNFEFNMLVLFKLQSTATVPSGQFRHK